MGNDGETIQQRPRTGATRCPFCHDHCDASQEVCACAECLSRHHVGCWEESEGCASCRSDQRLVGPETAHAQVGKRRINYGEVIDAWLKLGLLYNGSLAALTTLILRERLLSPLALNVLFGALLANLCFLLGPASEVIARRIGFRKTETLRHVVFWAGFSLALFLAFICCVFAP